MTNEIKMLKKEDKESQNTFDESSSGIKRKWGITKPGVSNCVVGEYTNVKRFGGSKYTRERET